MQRVQYRSQGAVLNLENYFEKLGIRYFKHLYRKVKAEHYIHIEGLPSDKIMQVIVQNITLNSLFIAFLVGALTTVPAVLIEIWYKTTMDTAHYYMLLGSVTLVMLIIELGVLYWLGLHAVHTLATITGHYQLEPDPTIPLEYQVERMLVRSALELPDPVVSYLGIDPTKNLSQKRVMLAGLLYKAKVILTSVILKLLLRKVAGRFGVRMGFVWVSIPVTAFWDAWVMLHVIKDARLRLFGYQLSLYIIREILTEDFLSRLTPQTRLAAIRAVASVMVMANRYHPNNMLLLIRLSDNLRIKEEGDYDNWQKFLEALKAAGEKERKFLLSLLAVAAAFDGKISKKERHYLPMAFADQTENYFHSIEEMIDLLEDGQLHKAAHRTETLLKF